MFEDGQIQLFTWNDGQGKEMPFGTLPPMYWHRPFLPFILKAKLTIGPAIENGFYYDVDFGDHSITEKELKDIEKKFLDFAKQKFEFKMRSASKQEALDFYHKNENQYKIELIENLEDGTITFCDHADFTDLCRGGHIPHTGFIKAVKLLNVAGAYWRGDENNKQLTRSMAYLFPNKRVDRIPRTLGRSQKARP